MSDVFDPLGDAGMSDLPQMNLLGLGGLAGGLRFAACVLHTWDGFLLQKIMKVLTD